MNNGNDVLVDFILSGNGSNNVVVRNILLAVRGNVGWGESPNLGEATPILSRERNFTEENLYLENLDLNFKVDFR